MLHQKVHYLLIAIGVNTTKLSRMLIRLNSDQVIRLERSYAHAYGLGNPYATKGDYNIYKLRDDIRAKTHKAIAAALIGFLQKKNPLPEQVTKEKAAKKSATKAWSSSDRELSKKRLSDNNLWPSRYRSPKASFDGLIRNRIQGWGEWVLANYQFLHNKSNPATSNLRIQFNWPEKKDLPKSLNDKKRYGDFALFLDVGNQFDQILIELRRMAQSASYSKGTNVAGYIKKLRQVEEVFSKTKGKTADTMLEGIKDRIRKVEQGDYQ